MESTISRLYIFLACFILFISGCKQKESVSKLEKEVLAIHDEVMPKMADINNLLVKFTALKDQFLNGPDSILVNEIVAIDSMILLLEEADEAMMNWMRQYKSPGKDMEEEEAKNYLIKEKEKILAVRKIMNEHIETATTAWDKTQSE